MKLFLKRAGLATGMVLASGAAMATPNTAAAVTALEGAGTAIAAIGAAMVTAAAAGIVFRWVTAFLVK